MNYVAVVIAFVVGFILGVAAGAMLQVTVSNMVMM